MITLDLIFNLRQRVFNCIDKMYTYRPTGGQVLEPGCAAAHLQRGHIELFHERHAAAIPHLQRAMALQPSLVMIHVELGLALQATGAYDQALDIMGRAAVRPLPSFVLHPCIISACLLGSFCSMSGVVRYYLPICAKTMLSMQAGSELNSQCLARL